MILFLTLIYCALLAILVKLKIVPLNLWWKLSPLILLVFLNIVMFVPMQFWAPAGPVVVVQNSVAVVSNVAGQVTEVAVEPNQSVKRGDLLLKLDKEPFMAARDQLAAQLELAEIQLADSEILIKQQAISQSRLDRDRAQVKQLRAALRGAQYNLDQTEIRATVDGFVTNLGVRPGARVATLPLAPVMTIVEDDTPMFVAQIPQSYLRYVQEGLEAEVTLKMFPGTTFAGEVDYVINATAQGQVSPNGTMVAPRDLQAVPMGVRVRLEEGELPGNLPAGAIGDVAIYSEVGRPTHIIRKVMIRMTSFVNYVNPF
ncbi:MAG: HlyD family secretion protein [Pseudomonadales bacterium]|nr:HlyD family secretion protein [Pseudomonadales bacterium]